jgi:hypothetical protein
MLKEGEVFSLINFDENYFFKWHNEIQKKYWCNNFTKLGKKMNKIEKKLGKESFIVKKWE